MFRVYDREIFFKLFMPVCRICLRNSNRLRFKTEHIGICQTCIDHLNEAPEPAQFSEGRIGDLLQRGMAKRDPNYTEAEYQRALPGWLNHLLADPKNNGIDFKRVRAYRRGLLRVTGERKWDYPSDWAERARRIRKRDQCCQVCGECDISLDVHHIIYLSKYGTNRQENLVSLCRSCHEEEHGRVFDFGEREELENLNPIRPTIASKPPASQIDFSCPQCATELTLPAHQAIRGQKLRCKQCGLIFLYGITTSLAGTSHVAPAPAPMRQTEAPVTPREVTSDSRTKQRKPTKIIAADLWILLAISIFMLVILSTA